MPGHKTCKLLVTNSSTLTWKIPWRRSLVCCSPWGHKESDTTERLHFHFHALEKEMATHSSVIAWRIPGTGEPGGLLSMGSHRVGHDGSNLAAAARGWNTECARVRNWICGGKQDQQPQMQGGT